MKILFHADLLAEMGHDWAEAFANRLEAEQVEVTDRRDAVEAEFRVLEDGDGDDTRGD